MAFSGMPSSATPQAGASGGFQGMKLPTATPAPTVVPKQPQIVAPAPSVTTPNFPGLGGAPVGTTSTPQSSPLDTVANVAGAVLPSFAPFFSAMKLIAPEVSGAIQGFESTPTTPKTTDIVAGVGGGTTAAAQNAFQGGVLALDKIATSLNLSTTGKYPTIQPNDETPLTRLSQGEDGVIGVVNSIFGVMLSPLQGYASTPVLGSVIDGVNKVFGAIGGGSSAGAEQAVNQLPVSQQTKDTIMQPVKDTAALAAQMVVGKLGADALDTTVSKVIYHAKLILTNLSSDPATKIPVTSESPADATPISIKTPSKLQLPAPEQSVQIQAPEAPKLLPAANPDTPVTGEGFTMTDKADPQKVALGKAQNAYDAALSKHTDNPTPKSLAAVIKARDALQALKNPQPTEAETAPIAKAAPTETAPAPAPAKALPVEKTPTTIDRPVLPDGTRVTKGANDINQHLVEQGLKELTPDEQARYTTGSYKDSKAQADIMAKTDRASLNQMALTGKDIPGGVHPQIVFNTVRDLAKAEKDYPLLQQLAKSPLLEERSGAAGKLGSAGYGQEKGSNAEIDALRRAQEAKSGGEKGAKAVAAKAKEAKATITKTAARMMDYNKIIDAITC